MSEKKRWTMEYQTLSGEQARILDEHFTVARGDSKSYEDCLRYSNAKYFQGYPHISNAVTNSRILIDKRAQKISFVDETKDYVTIFIESKS